jgi:hypothetical protein
MCIEINRNLAFPTLFPLYADRQSINLHFQTPHIESDVLLTFGSKKRNNLLPKYSKLFNSDDYLRELTEFELQNRKLGDDYKVRLEEEIGRAHV